MRSLLVSIFMSSFALGIISLAIPLYANELGADYVQLGLLGAAYVVFEVILSIPAGKLSDRYGRKQFLVAGLLSTSIVFALYAQAKTVVFLLALRLLHGITETPIWVNAQSSVADSSKISNRGHAMGAYGSSWGFGIALGPLAGGFIYSIYGAQACFSIAALIMASAAVVALQTVFPRPPKVEKLEAKGGMPRFLPIACSIGLVYLGMVSIIFSLFPVYAQRLGMSSQEVGLLFSAFAFVRASFFIPMGSLSDKIGYRPLILTGLSGAALAFIMLASMTGRVFVVASILLVSLSTGAIYPASLSMVSKIAGSSNRGRVMGIYNSISTIGWAIFPAVGGAIAEFISPSAPYALSAVAAIISLLFLWRKMPVSISES
jgi:MFS family permease